MPNILHPWKGTVTGLVGPMGSEKTSRLILKANDARKHREGVGVFQPVLGRRRDPGEIITRSGLIYTGAFDYKHPEEILVHFKAHPVKHAFFDEPQFNDKIKSDRIAFQNVIRALLDYENGVNIYYAALRRDFLGEPFETTTWLMGITDDHQLNLLEGECDLCHRKPAPFAQRLRNGKPVTRKDPRFITDNSENQLEGVTYETRCVLCYQIADE